MPNSLTRRKKTINVLRVAIRLTICHDSGYLLRPFSLPSPTPFSTPICFRSLIHAVMRLRFRVDSREIFRRLVGSIISSFVCLRRNPRNAYVSDYAYGKYSSDPSTTLVTNWTNLKNRWKPVKSIEIIDSTYSWQEPSVGSACDHRLRTKTKKIKDTANEEITVACFLLESRSFDRYRCIWPARSSIEKQRSLINQKLLLGIRMRVCRGSR